MRVGIIGVGWGSVVQVPAFQAVEGFEVVALCSRRPERAAAAAEKLGVPESTTDWESFVRRDDLDVISICTPVDLHREQTLGAIAAGKHVLVEKPVGLDASETAEMLAAAEEAGVRHAVCFEGRYEPSRLAMTDAVRDGMLGTPYLALARSGGDFWHPSRGIQSEWMYRRDAGGGYLMGLASHDIDYICSLFGVPSAVCADVRTTVARRTRDDGTILEVDADDTSALLIRMADGALASVNTTAVALGESFRSLQLFGSDGSITLDGPMLAADSVPIVVGTPGEPKKEVPPMERPLASNAEIPSRRAAGAIKSLALLLEDWRASFDGADAPDVPTLVDGHRVQQIVDAARLSSDGRGWVTLQ